MAKKDITPTPEPHKFFDLTEEIPAEVLIPSTWEDKVKTLRSKGFDDNRIAAILMIAKEKVQQVQ